MKVIDELEKLSKKYQNIDWGYHAVPVDPKLIDKLIDVVKAARAQHCGNPDCGQHGKRLGRTLAALKDNNE